MASGRELKEKFWDELEDSPFVMIGLSGVDNTHSQPMTAQFDDDLPNEIYFYCKRDNRLVSALSSSQAAVVNFAAKDHSLFACVHGMLSVDNDPAKIDKFWSQVVGAWFDGGKDDPELTLLKFDAGNAEIWKSEQSDFLHYMATAIMKGDASEASEDDVKTVRF